MSNTLLEYPNREELVFQKIFGALPELYLVLSTDLIILAVNEAYLKATLTTRENIIRKHVFEAFPDNPDVPDANGVANLNASLQQVLSTGQPHEMPVQHYDVPRPAELGGGFETRYWLPLNTPVLDEEGQVLYIVHQVTNVTEQVAERQKGDQNEVLQQGLAYTFPVALWMTDTVGAVSYVNQTWIDWTGRGLRNTWDRVGPFLSWRRTGSKLWANSMVVRTPARTIRQTSGYFMLTEPSTGARQRACPVT